MNKIQAVLAAALCLGLTAAAHAQTNFVFQADAYGTYANVGNTVIAGKTALSALGCGSLTPPAHDQNTVLNVSAPPLLTTGTITTNVDGSILANGTLRSRSIATVANASLLTLPVTGPLITATEIKAISTTTKDATGFHTNGANSSFTNLVVAGVAIVGTPAPNTTVALPGFGSVVLNEQISVIKSDSASLIVNMIHVFITETNVLGLSVGTEIIVAHAYSSLKAAKQGTLDGRAYGTKATIGSVVTSGESALVLMPCLGTNGVLKTNSVAQVVADPLFSVGEVLTTALGTVNATTAMGETTSTIQDVNVATSLVTASVVKADAHASKINGVFSFSDTGSMFVGLTVAGFPLIDDNVAPNTSVAIVGLGTLWLHRVIQTPNYIEIRMIELIVDQANIFNIPVGTTIRVGVARASAH